MNQTLSRVVNTVKSVARSLSSYNYGTICDIAYPQTIIDWNRLKELDVGIIMRAGQANYEDTMFRTHYNNAVHSKVPFGIYWFFQPDMNYIYQLNKFMSIYDSLEVKPNRLYVDIEPIVYTGVSIYPPSKEVHTYWLSMFLQGIYEHTGILTSIYTRQNYWDEWIVESNTRYLYNGMPYYAPQWDKYDLWIASWTIYSSNIRMPRDWEYWKIWQYEGGTGRQDGITGPVDKNYFNGTTEEMIDYFGGTNMVAAIPNTAVSQLDRARILEITSDLQVMDMTQATVDGVLVKLGGMDGEDGSGKELYVESGYDIRIDQARNSNLVVLGQFGLRAGYHLFKQRTLDFVDSQAPEDNEVLSQLLNQIKNKPVDGLLLLIWDTHAYNGTVNDVWQRATIENILKPLLVKRANGEIPDIPIIIQSNPGFFSTYQADTQTYLYNRKDDIYISLSQWIYSATPGPVLQNINVLFDTYSPSNSFTYASRPYGFEDKVISHEFTAGRFSVPTLAWNKEGTNVLLTCMLFWDTPEEFRSFFKISTPSPSLPPPSNELEERVKALEDRVTLLEDSSSTMSNIIKIGITKLKEFLTEIGV